MNSYVSRLVRCCGWKGMVTGALLFSVFRHNNDMAQQFRTPAEEIHHHLSSSQKKDNNNNMHTIMSKWPVLPHDDTIIVPTTSVGGSSASLDKVISSSYDLATIESFGFFDDIPNNEWKRMKQRFHDVYPNVLLHNNETFNELRLKPILSHDFYQNHYEPDFTCRHERRIGRLGDGGKWVCDPHRLGARMANQNNNNNNNCLVYSVGSRGDVSFEQAILDLNPHCEVHTFDMDDYSVEVESIGAKFHQWGILNETRTIQDTNGQTIFKTFKETVQELDHMNRTIDIFKIDCEGCEWDSYNTWFEKTGDVPMMRQILIELHGIKDTTPSTTTGGRKRQRQHTMQLPESYDFFVEFQKQGYVIFHKEMNIQSGRCIEYGFLNLHPQFFQ